jgi:outer membrane protein
MNKVISGLFLAGLIGVSAQADVLRLEAGAGVWDQEPDGYLQYKNAPSFTDSDVGYSNEKKMYAWINVKHPVPILPNVRLEYTPMEFSGTSTTGFEYDGTTFSAGAKSTLSMDQYDAILYYNILDNTGWTTIDVGLDIKYIDTSFQANETGNSVSQSDGIALPMAYGRLRFEIPATDIGLEGDIKYTGYKNSKVYDYRIKADYSLDLSVIDLGLEAGYRFQRINIDSGDFSSLDTTGDIDISGFYAGVMVRF